MPAEPPAVDPSIPTRRIDARHTVTYIPTYTFTMKPMGQVTIYLDDEHERRMRQAAAEAGQPVSRWVAGLIEARTRTHWPQSVRDLAGQWDDFPTLEELRDDQPDDAPREPV
jgi:hypothetical protein